MSKENLNAALNRNTFTITHSSCMWSTAVKIRSSGTVLKLCVHLCVSWRQTKSDRILQMCFISPCHDPDKQSAASMYGLSCSRVIYMQHVSVIIRSTESAVFPSPVGRVTFRSRSHKTLLPTYTVQKSTNMGFSIVNVK